MQDFNVLILSFGIIFLTNLILLVAESFSKIIPGNVTWAIHARIILNVVFALLLVLSIFYFKQMFVPVVVAFTICQIALTILTYRLRK